MSVNKGQNARALVEPLALDSRTLGDGDLSALSLSHNNEQYSSNDFEAFANIQAELECMNAEEVMTTDEEHIIIERNIQTETIVPDVEMTEVLGKLKKNILFIQQQIKIIKILYFKQNQRYKGFLHPQYR